jgi:hypothetical protein
MLLTTLFVPTLLLAADPPPILPSKQVNDARALVAELAEWIISLDLGSGTVKGYNHSLNHLNHSIFINGNLARVLMGSHVLTGNTTHLAEALRWCESFVKEQQVGPTAQQGIEGGFWGVGYPTSVPLADGSLYLGDTGTAVTALARCASLTTDASQRQRFMTALRLYDAFVRHGCTTPGCGASRRGAKPALGGFVNASSGGAIGCGYYEGHLSTCPYIIATGTTGAAFEAELMALTREADPVAAMASEKLVVESMAYMAAQVSAENGTLPYIIDCQPPTWTEWPLDTATYVIEGVVAGWLHVPSLRAGIPKRFLPTADWLLRTQNEDGSWGRPGPDRQRSPRVTSLLALLHVAAVNDGKVPDPRWAAALSRYVDFLSESGRAAQAIAGELRESGFAGLALLDLIHFGVTFGPAAQR